jgi:hypothetical protein
MKKYKVIFRSTYSDGGVDCEVVEAKSKIHAIFQMDNAYLIFPEDYFDEDGEMLETKLPKTMQEVDELSHKTDTIVTVEKLY